MTSQSRSFSILDLILLIAALAIGFALTRETLGLSMISDGVSVHYRSDNDQLTIRGAKNSWLYFPSSSKTMAPRWSVKLQYPIFCATPCLTVFTLAVLVSSFRQPRPPLRRLFRRPGIIAGIAVVLALVGCMLQYPMLLASRGGVRIGVNGVETWPIWRIQVWFFLPRQAGFAVLVAWLTQWLTRGFHPNSAWTDRLGCFLGFCWMVLGLTTIVASIFFGFGN